MGVHLIQVWTLYTKSANEKGNQVSSTSEEEMEILKSPNNN